MENKLCIRNMLLTDWKQVALIYKQGIDTGNATFQQNVPTMEEWDKSHLGYCRLVACLNEEIIGWAALSKVSDRCVYGGVAEVSVYVSTSHTGKKVGTQLLHTLIKESEANGIWTLQAGIFPENATSC